MYYVVCDANGTCHGIFTDEEVANRLATYVGAYVSGHEPNSISINEVEVSGEAETLKSLVRE